MRRIMSIKFAQLPLDRRIRMGDPRTSGVFAIVRETKNALRLTHLSPAAIDAGLHPGLGLPDARALCPELLTEQADPVREDLLLRALWRWSDTLSPWVALDVPDGLFLNITGCAHLFGGEAEMSRYALERLSDMDIMASVGIADTKRAAWALARFTANHINIAAKGDCAQALAPLPLAALNIKARTLTDLRRVGLKTIGELYGKKTSELARRFGLDLTNNLSHALGHSPDPVSPQTATKVYAARMTLPDPIGRLDDINHVLLRLATSVCTRLETAQIGARRFDLTVRCTDTGDHVLTAGFARPCFKTGPILQQFSKPLSQLKLAFGADWFRLIADSLEPVRPKQLIIGEEDVRRDEEFSQLLSTLGNRLGFDRIRKFTPCDGHLPEREFTSLEVLQSKEQDWSCNVRTRPFRTFPRPERLRTLETGRPPRRFQWRRTVYNTQSATGPERLAPDWWRQHDKRIRDYWTVETDNGMRLWLLTYPGGATPEWFVAGRFA